MHNIKKKGFKKKYNKIILKSYQNHMDVISIDLYPSQRQLRNNVVITRSYVPFRGHKCIVSFG